MEIIRTQIQIGLETPVRVLHISDVHLTLADMRDGERKVKLAEARLPAFPHAEALLQEVGDLSKEQNLPILTTGDLIDFVSLANLEAVKAFTDSHDCFTAAGNHDFSLYVGEAWEDADYRNQSLEKVQACYKNDIRMSSRIIGGVNFVALDNGYYCFEPCQLEFLKQEAEKGLPMVLMFHTPLYDRALYDFELARAPGCAYLTGVPEELMAHYEDYRYKQQKADAMTLKVMDYIANQPLVKLILTGHLHINHEAMFAGRIPQLFSGNNAVRMIEFV